AARAPTASAMRTGIGFNRTGRFFPSIFSPKAAAPGRHNTRSALAHPGLLEDEEREGELEGGERESGEDRDPESLLAPEEAQELAAEDGQGGPEDRPAGAGGAGHGAGFYCRVPLDCLDCPTKQPYQR